MSCAVATRLYKQSILCKTHIVVMLQTGTPHFVPRRTVVRPYILWILTYTVFSVMFSCIMGMAGVQKPSTSFVSRLPLHGYAFS